MILINLIIVFILFVIFKLWLEARNSEAIYVKSSIDGKDYLVRNLPDKVDAADHICQIKGKLNRMVEYLKTNFPNDERVQRLEQNWQEDALSEAPVDSKHTSYSI